MSLWLLLAYIWAFVLSWVIAPRWLVVLLDAVQIAMDTGLQWMRDRLPWPGTRR